MRTILQDLPYDCRGFIVENIETGEQCCVLNARMSHEANLKTYQHECNHMKHDDLHCSEDINTIEYKRHRPLNIKK